jgi:hypothetical protein
MERRIGAAHLIERVRAQAGKLGLARLIPK